jgi:protein N-terminal methyltransferase
MADMEVDASDTDSRISIPDQLAYWAQISADDNGMLGGYPQISRIDIQFSRTFLRKLQRMYPGSVPGLGSDGNDDNNDDDNNMSGRTRGRGRGATGATTTKETMTTTTTTTKKYAFRHCLETGAGIGRVTFNLLAGMCERIDIIEPIEKFTHVLTDKDSPIVKAGQLRRVWNVPLQEWTVGMEPSWECGDGDGDGDGDEPEQKRQQQRQQHMDSNPNANANATHETRAATGEKENRKGEEEGRYDLIYNQWCLNHLTFESLVRYFASLIPLLAKGGWIIVKENLSTEVSGGDTFWEEDSSVARSDGNWRASFDKAGLKVVATQLQTGFPKQLGLLPVRMYALRPVEHLQKTG